jgi:hypothetical protein
VRRLAPAPREGSGIARVQEWAERFATMEWCYLVLALALVEQLPFFFWGAAIGANVFAAIYFVLGMVSAGKRAVTWLERAMLPLGVLALGVLVWGAGTDNVLGIVERVGLLWFGIVIAQELVAHAANTFGLIVCMPRDRASLPFWRTFAARLAGEGVNATMPTATIGGELLKISLLARRVPTERVTAGVTAAYATQALAQMLFTALALPLALPALELPHVPQIALRLMAGVFVLGGLAFTYWMASVLRSGAFGRVHGLLRKVGLGREGSDAHSASERIDAAARTAHFENPRAFVASVLWFFFGWAWGAVEVAIILHAIGEKVDWPACFAIESLSAFIDALCLFVPGQIGTREGGLAAITFGIGLGADVGIAIGLVRRGRTLAWAALGLVCLAWFRRNPETAAAAKTDEPVRLPLIASRAT